jgi:hypothetical protein
MVGLGAAVGVLVGEDMGVGGTIVGVGEGDGVGVKVGGLAVEVDVEVGRGVAQLISSGVGVGNRLVAARRSGLRATSKTAVRQARPITAISPTIKY